jgi:phosphoglucomutase
MLDFHSWLKKPFDEKTQFKVKELINNPIDLEDAFNKNLEFGTGGMRGIMGVGPNRINKYTIGKNTQGLSNYLNNKYNSIQIKTIVAYDSRKNSKKLAKIVANIFSANNIHCLLFSELRPTPELSFAVRYFQAQCGIVITASHNPPKYNGYKVYGDDGGQLTPPQDDRIIKEINKIDYNDILFKSNPLKLTFIDSEIDNEYFKAVLSLGKFNNKKHKNYKVVFTPLHGSSIKAIPQILKLAGYNDVKIVKEQSKPDGNFPTVKSPNPEDKEALLIAINKAKKMKADIVIGSDPDSDRLGIAILSYENKWEILNGNQMMMIMIDFLLSNYNRKKSPNGNEFIASTIVSSPMIKLIANHFNIEYKETLTGFKWISKLINDNPNKNFIAGGEESLGFLIGDKIRDKDAVLSALLACEIGFIAKNNNKIFFDLLIDCYKKYGFFLEELISYTKNGENGSKIISNTIKTYRNNPPNKIAGIDVEFFEDYNTSIIHNLISGNNEIIKLPKSNVIIFRLIDSSMIAIRPSGTEPKIKFYISVNNKFNSNESWSSQKNILEEKIKLIKNEFINL